MSDYEPLAQFHLRLAAPDSDIDGLDELTQNLWREMVESDVERIDLVSGDDLPVGTKGGLVTAHGELNVTLRPASLPDFLGMVRDWLSRQNQRVEIVATVGSSTFHINASITDISTIMQALGNLNAPQGGASVTNQSGGADLNADQINVGGDITGRDKIVQIHAEAGATVYIGRAESASVRPNDDAVADQPPPAPAAASTSLT